MSHSDSFDENEDSDSDVQYNDNKNSSFDSEEFNNIMWWPGTGFDSDEDNPEISIDNIGISWGPMDGEPGAIGYDDYDDNDGFGFMLDEYVDGEIKFD